MHKWTHGDAVAALTACRKVESALLVFEAGVDPQKAEGSHGHDAVCTLAAEAVKALWVLKASVK